MRSFTIIISSHNAQEAVERNLDSIFSQTYDKFRIIYIDDCSQDETLAVAKKYLKKNKLEHRVTWVQNEKRSGALANLYHAAASLDLSEIILYLNGNDWLAHREVLAQLNTLYCDPSIWLTYGPSIQYPTYEFNPLPSLSEEIIAHPHFRDLSIALPAFFSAYAALLQRCDLKDIPLSASDNILPLLFPLFEMAGEHQRQTPQVGLVCNTLMTGPLLEEEIPLDRTKKYLPLSNNPGQTPLKKVYITPGLWGELFAISNPLYNRDGCLDVLFQLREIAYEAGYELIQADSIEDLEEFEYLILFEFNPEQIPYLERYPKEKLILFLWEPPTVIGGNYFAENHQYFSKIYTWRDDLVDNRHYFKFYYPVLRSMIPQPIDFYLRRFSTLIASNKESPHPEEIYSERMNVIQFFESFSHDDFDLYGRWWPSSYDHYRGSIDKKVDCLKYYKFCFSFENIKNTPGYITEKIFDCFQAGCIPIYWGAPNVDDYIPKNCYISREDFDDLNSLYRFLKSIDEKQHRQYLANIASFLTSESAQLYSVENFHQIFMQLITTPPNQ